MPFIMINKQKFFNNLDIIAQKTQSKDKIALVLKDNAYGHGLEQIAALAKEWGVTKAVVQNETEAQKIAPYFDYILVLADIPSDYHDKKIRWSINSIESIEKFPPHTKVELKVDTGMHRNGIDPSELERAFIMIKKRKLALEAVFTHHKNADALTSEWFWQNENFKRIKKEARSLARRYALAPLRFHSANSASLFRTRNFNEDMARVGIAAYGCLEMHPIVEVPLEPILSLYAKKLVTRKLKKGQKVGYGGEFIAKEACVVSTYDIGYGDGFFRALSSCYVTPQGIAVAGRISMDNTSFLGDEAELLVFDDARAVAKAAHTIPYEILTALKESIPRFIC